MTRPDMTVKSCGIRVAGSSMSDTVAAVREIQQEIGPNHYQHLLVLFSVEHKGRDVCAAIQQFFPGVSYSGCTTSGEISQNGMTTGTILIIAFPYHGFRICVEAIEDIGRFGVERATNAVRSLRSRLLSGHLTRPSNAMGFGPNADQASDATSAFSVSEAASLPNLMSSSSAHQQGARATDDNAVAHGAPLHERVFGLLFVDGLSNFEETLVAAINWAMGDLQVVGGSSGDNLSFEQTLLIHNGRVLQNSAILLMVESAFPFKAFTTQHFDPTPIKLVVTAASPEKRIVHELNAENAAQEYARAIGLMPDSINPFCFASHPLVVRVGDEYICRSIQRVNEDGSLSFFCAIDEGLVLTVARPRDMVLSTTQVFSQLEDALGGLDLVIGFDCVLRRLDAESRQVRHELEATYQKNNLVGFHSYGEQFNALHLNQTLTGIAFGSRQAF